MITLFGATGYTGTLIAQVLDRKAIPYRIAGRSEEKLRSLSGRLNSHPEFLTADVERPETLTILFQNTTVLINCAGPFTDLGEKVAALAAVHGVHYLDTTNELGYVYRLRTYDKIAQKTGAALVPACAFEVALSDCAAALLGKSTREKPNQIDVVYHLAGSGASRGTRLSALRSLATSWLGYQDGQWTGSAPGSRRSRFTLAEGPQAVVSFPSSESVTLTRHLDPRRINTWMTAAPISAFLAPVFLPLFARFLRSLPGRSVLWAAGLRRSTVQDHIRTGVPFEIRILLTTGRETRAVSITGKGAYEITAEIAAYAVEKMAAPDFQSCGFLAPAQVFDPRDFFTTAQAWGILLTPKIGDVNGG